MVEACDFLEVKTDLLNMRVQGNKLYIGEASRCWLWICRRRRTNVHYEQEDIPFKKEVKLSPDLLQGKRQKVLNTCIELFITRPHVKLRKRRGLPGNMGKERTGRKW